MRLVDGTSRTSIVTDGHAPGDGPADTLARVLHSAASAWGSKLDLTCVAVGLTGLHGRTPRGTDFRAALPVGWRVREVRVVDDGIAAHLAGLGGHPGVVVAVGTGVTAVAWDGRDRWASADGRGPLLGDRGGGFWIGHEGLRAAIRAVDGSRSSIPLAELAVARFGDLALLHDKLAFMPPSVKAIAAFCVDVFEAARSGDPVAGSILDQAGDEIGATTVACATKAGLGRGAQFAMIGGIIQGGPLLVTRWRSYVESHEPSFEWKASRRQPIDALAALSRGRIPVGYESVVAIS